MKNLLKLPAFLVLLTLGTLLTGCVAAGPGVAVQAYPPRPVYYQPRSRVVIVPAPVVRPRTVIVAPGRPYYHGYNARPPRYGYGRRR